MVAGTMSSTLVGGISLNAMSFGSAVSGLIQQSDIGVVPVGQPFGTFASLGSIVKPLNIIRLPSAGGPFVSVYRGLESKKHLSDEVNIGRAKKFMQYHLDNAVMGAERIVSEAPLRTSALEEFKKGELQQAGGEYKGALLHFVHSAAIFLRIGERPDIIKAVNAMELAKTSWRGLNSSDPLGAIIAECRACCAELALKKLCPDGASKMSVRSGDENGGVELAEDTDVNCWQNGEALRGKLRADRKRAARMWQQFIKFHKGGLDNNGFGIAAYHSAYNAYLSGDPQQIGFSFSRAAKTYEFRKVEDEAAFNYLRALWGITLASPVESEDWPYVSRWLDKFQSLVWSGWKLHGFRKELSPDFRDSIDRLIQAADFYAAIDGAAEGPAKEIALSTDEDGNFEIERHLLYEPVGKWFSRSDDFSETWNGMDFKDQGRLVSCAATILAGRVDSSSYSYDATSNLIIFDDAVVKSAAKEAVQSFQTN